MSTLEVLISNIEKSRAKNTRKKIAGNVYVNAFVKLFYLLVSATDVRGSEGISKFLLQACYLGCRKGMQKLYYLLLFLTQIFSDKQLISSINHLFINNLK